MSSSRKENAFHCWLCEDYRGMTKTLNIPAKAIKAAGFNTRNPIFVQEIGENHFGLTQNGSYDDIVRSVNGWKQPNGKTKTYRLGVQKLVNFNCDSVMLVPDDDANYIDVIGVSFFG